jgi:hypothetical protein
MSDPRIKGPLSMIAVPLGDAMAQHQAAPPLRKNQNRAVWGTWLIVAGVYAVHDFIARYHVDVGKLAAGFARDPGGTASAVGWPFVIECTMIPFGALWVWVGVHGARGPREIMGTFWSLCFAGGCAYALVHGVYIDGDPDMNWYLKGFYLASLAASLMGLFLYARGPGGGNAAQLVQQQIQQQAQPWRIGRRRKF